MKTLLLANNRVGHRGMKIVRESGLTIAGLVVHPPERARYREEILAAADLPPERVLEAPALRTPEGLEQVRGLGAELALSLYFGYLLKPEFLRLFPRGVLNLHPACLPYNRGAYPNVFAILEGTRAGVTLHVIDEGVDTGDIVAQREVPVREWDTGESLYVRLEEAGLDLLTEVLPRIAAGQRLPRTPQPPGGTFHRTKDVRALDEIDLDREVRARDLIDLLRARTFPPHRGAWFRAADGRRVYLELRLIPEEEEGE